jgi:hypothetical protein
MNDIRGEFGLQRASSWKEAALAMDELFPCRWSQLGRLFFVLFLSFLWWARCELLPVFGLVWIVSFILRADALVFLRSAIIDENCLTVDMNDIAPHFTLVLTAVPLLTMLVPRSLFILRLPRLSGRFRAADARASKLRSPKLRLNSI